MGYTGGTKGCTGDADTEQDSLLEKERRALFLLSRIEGMYADKLLRMYEYAGSFSEACRVPAQEYERMGLFSHAENGRKLLFTYDRRQEREQADLREYDSLSARGIRFCTFLDEDYPKRLLPLPDRPLLLYVRGSLPKDALPSAAVIGARICSDYGRETAVYFASALSEAGIQIVSGMAAGIDGTAQAAALRTGGKSFAVLGSGVDICYPRENEAIYRRMAAGAGGVISEFPPKSPGLPFHFVLRNRIIAGLCDVLLVLEARERSGTSITVAQALEQGREVFALPGRIDDPLGRGCNALLRDGASVLTSPDDVLESLCFRFPNWQNEGKISGKTAGQGQTAALDKKISGLAKTEKIVYSCVDTTEQHVEVIARKAGLPISQTADSLLKLELLDLAASPSSGYYRRLGKR